MSFLALSFSAPLVLLALAAAPLLYLLLRVTPPDPARIAFPPLKLILDLKKPDATPARTPLWLLLLRMALAALVILAMAGPVFTPATAPLAKSGPLLLVLDDGWPAAPDWAERVKAAESRIEQAGRAGRGAAIVAISEGSRPAALGDAATALSRLRALSPKPFLPDRLPALPALANFINAHGEAQLVWLSDGVESADGRAFAGKLAALAPDVEILRDPRPVRALAGAENKATALEASLLRSAVGGQAQGLLRAFDQKGALLGEAPFDFDAGLTATARLTLPVEIRNDVARLDLSGESSAGAVFLLDAGARRRRIGLVAGASVDVAQPLLSPLYYLRKALGPFADLREAKPGDPDPIGHLLDEGVDVLVLADAGAGGTALSQRLDEFLAAGGTILRFAGPRLAAGGDELTPAHLRRGGRTLGGALSWDQPKKLAPFDANSPFFGLTPPAEATVSRQVLAEPEEGLPGKTWARLADGTPLVTAERRGPGLLILFHITADTTWSNLPLSELFVDMLRRIANLSALVAKKAAPDSEAPLGGEPLPPSQTLDGFGVLGAPPATAKPMLASGNILVSAEHPPGFYGPPDAPRALNAMAPGARLAPLDISGLSLKSAELTQAQPVDLRPPLLVAAFVLALADALASLVLGGRWRRQAALAMLALTLGFAPLAPPPAQAEPARTSQKVSPRDVESALATRLAYVVTGDAHVDEISRQGLTSLSEVLAQRTALNPGPPIGVDPARDELAFYPLIYWPIAPETPQPGPESAKKLGAYMKQGGLVLFDTRDAMFQQPGGPETAARRWLRAYLADVDLPALEPVPRDHVVTKTFYLLDNIVGRTVDGQTLIEALPPEPADPANRPARAGDSVSPVIIASNDLAAAWAGGAFGEALYPLQPGGERQRELALRGGVNIVMYTLTGNYKADQVHVRELLERLGH